MGSTETTDDGLWQVEARAVGAGAASGIVAGVGMGIVLQLGTELMPVFGAFAGETSALRGWLVHLVVSLLYGVLFAMIVAYPPIRSFVTELDGPEYLLMGITYAVMIAAVTIALLPFVFELPWVQASFQASARNVPGPDLGGLLPALVFGVAHVVYGGILGFVYAWIGSTPTS